MIKTDCSYACQKPKERAGFAEESMCQLLVGTTEVVLGPLVIEPAQFVAGDVFQRRQYKRFTSSYMFSWFVCKNGLFFADFQLQQCCSTELLGLMMFVLFHVWY